MSVYGPRPPKDIYSALGGRSEAQLGSSGVILFEAYAMKGQDIRSRHFFKM